MGKNSYERQDESLSWPISQKLTGKRSWALMG